MTISKRKGTTIPARQGRPAGGEPPRWPGTGRGIDDATHEPNDAILGYFQQVDTGLRAFIRDEHAPVVLAGVEFLLPIFRRANTYAYVLEEGVTGNPEDSVQKNSRSAPGRLCSRTFSGPAKRRRPIPPLVGTGRASGDIVAVGPAAYDGLVIRCLWR